MVIDGLVHRGRGLREPRWVAQVHPEELRLAVNARQAAGPEDPLHHAPGSPRTTHRVTGGATATLGAPSQRASQGSQASMLQNHFLRN